MNKNILSVRRSVVSPEAVIEHILLRYPLNQPIACQLFAHSHDDLYRVWASSDEFVLRLYAHGNRREDLVAQAVILERMADAKLPVVQPIPGDRGYVVDVPAPEGMRYAMLYKHVAGIPVGRTMLPSQASAYGQLVANMHDAADREVLAARLMIDLAYLVDEPICIIKAALKHRPRDLQSLEQKGERLKRAVCDLPRSRPAFGLCHGDLHKSNLLCDPTGKLTLIDWDCLGMGWRAYDLAILRWSIGPAVGPEGIGEPRLRDVWQAYLDAYQRIHPLAAEELAAIPHFVAIRHIRVMGWQVDRAVNGIDGVGTLTDEFFDWWFQSLEALAHAKNR